MTPITHQQVEPNDSYALYFAVATLDNGEKIYQFHEALTGWDFLHNVDTNKLDEYDDFVLLHEDDVNGMRDADNGYVVGNWEVGVVCRADVFEIE